MTDWTDLDEELPDDDPDVVEGMKRLAELRKLEAVVTDLNVRR